VPIPKKQLEHLQDIERKYNELKRDMAETTPGTERSVDARDSIMSDLEETKNEVTFGGTGACEDDPSDCEEISTEVRAYPALLPAKE
jgi:hypothetical protein